MKVYAVIGGNNYEGEVFDTLRLFDCKSAADAYRKEIAKYCDYTRMEIREICMESALSAT
jgi:hypothetical protein